MLNAIILAGEQPVKSWYHSGNKALICINNKLMIEYVIDALKNVDDIGKIVVVGPASELESYLTGKVDAVIDSNESIIDNLMAGIKYLGFNEHIIVCTCDIPMITSQAINDFIIKAKAIQPDICYPVVEKRLNEEKYPEVERTYIKLKDGTFTGGNIFYVNPVVLEKGYALAKKFLKYRKKPLKMAGVLGFGFIIQLLVGNLTICKIEKKFSDLLNIKARAVISEYPEIGNDVDKPSDIVVVTAHLSK